MCGWRMFTEERNQPTKRQSSSALDEPEAFPRGDTSKVWWPRPSVRLSPMKSSDLAQAGLDRLQQWLGGFPLIIRASTTLTSTGTNIIQAISKAFRQRLSAVLAVISVKNFSASVVRNQLPPHDTHQTCSRGFGRTGFQFLDSYAKKINTYSCILANAIIKTRIRRVGYLKNK